MLDTLDVHEELEFDDGEISIVVSRISGFMGSRGVTLTQLV